MIGYISNETAKDVDLMQVEIEDSLNEIQSVHPIMKDSLTGIEPDHEVTVAVHFSWQAQTREDNRVVTIPLPVLSGFGRWTDPLFQLSLSRVPVLA